MPLSLDSEYVTAIEPILPILQNAPKFPVGDVESRRAAVEGLFDLLMPAWPAMQDVDTKITHVKSKDGKFEVALHHITKSDTEASKPGPAVFYVHGGGYFTLSVKHYQKVLDLYVSQSGVPIIAVDYRLAPEAPFPIPLDDCYTGLHYLSTHAADFNVDPARIAVLGDSAGGGLAAGLALKARDEGLSPPLVKQMIIGGMLDDRSTSINHSAVLEFATWSDDDNKTGWAAYLGGNSTNVSAHAAPARVQSAKGLPSLYLEVPDLDIFKDENLEYAAKMSKENIETELHVWKGVPHSFELFSPGTETTSVAISLRVKAMKSL